MKKLFLGSLVLLAWELGAPAAFAAELPVAPAPTPAPVYTNWSGCYVGLSAGTSSGRSDGYSSTAASVFTTPGTGVRIPAFVQPITGSFNLTGFIGGAYAGCNYQAGVWVFGIEGDWSATNKEGQAFVLPGTVPAPGAAPLDPADTWHLQERWLSTARGRLGWTVWDKSLLYVTGGAAWAKFDTTETRTGTTFASIQTDRRTGWTVGGGWEYALGYGWLARAEYLYVDFGNWTTLTGTLPVPPISSLNVNLRDHIFRGGMSYKFW